MPRGLSLYEGFLCRNLLTEQPTVKPRDKFDSKFRVNNPRLEGSIQSEANIGDGNGGSSNPLAHHCLDFRHGDVSILGNRAKTKSEAIVLCHFLPFAIVGGERIAQTPSLFFSCAEVVHGVIGKVFTGIGVTALESPFNVFCGIHGIVV